MSGGLQPNSALGRKPLFPELGPYLLCQHERTFRRPAASNQLSSDIRFRSSAASDNVAEQRGISHHGAPPMKMGNPASPWRYDAAAYCTPEPENMRPPTNWRCAHRRQFSDFVVVSMLPQWTRRRAKIGIGGMSVLGGRPEVVDVRQNDAIDP